MRRVVPLTLAAAAVLCLLLAQLFREDAAAAPVVMLGHSPAPLTLAVQPGWAPIVRYDPATARLTVTRNLRADAEVCIHETCDLAANWLTAKGVR